MSKFYPFSFILLLAICVVAIVLSGGSLLVYISLPSLLVVLVTSIVLALGNFSLPEMGRYFGLAYRNTPAPSRNELHDALAFFDAITRYLIVAGFLGTLIGTMAMLTSLTEPSRIASGTALALTTILYALILWIGVLLPFRTGVRRRLAELEK